MPVVTVGVAFQRAMKERPELAMLGRDKAPESIHGVYLAANVICAPYWGRALKGFRITRRVFQRKKLPFLQGIGCRTVWEWQQQQ